MAEPSVRLAPARRRACNHRLSPHTNTDRQNPDTSPQAIHGSPVVQSSQFPRPPGPTASVPARAAVSFAPSASDPRGAQAVSSLGPRQAHRPLAPQARTPKPYPTIARRPPRAARPTILPTLPTGSGHATSTSPTSPLGADSDPGSRLRHRGLRAPANKASIFAGRTFASGCGITR
jgi:hypothetical protein